MLDVTFGILVFLLILVAAYKVLNWIGARAHAKIKQDQELRCKACGYDIRASQSFCPECGAPIGYQERISMDRIDFDLLERRWPSEPFEIRKPAPHEFLVDLSRSTDSGRIEKFGEFLRMQGIGCTIQMGESKEHHGGWTFQRLSLQVWSDDVEQAIELANGLSLYPVESPAPRESVG